MKKRVCFVNTTRSWGGGEKWHTDISSILSEDDNYDVFFVVNKKNEIVSRLPLDKIKIKQIKISNLSFFNIFKLFNLVKFFKKNEIETVILNLPADLKTSAIAAKIAGVKKIIYRRGSAIPIKNSISNRFLFSKVIDIIIANSKMTKKTILKNNKKIFPEENIKVVYNGLDTVEYLDRKYETVYTKQNDEIVIGNAGRLVKQKGQRYLIDIAKQLKDRGINFKILIAGDGELKQELENYAKQLGVLQEIEFLGFVENIKNFTESIDIFVLTSLWEGFGYVMVEAMLSGKPVIAFDVSSNPEIVEDEKTGYLVGNGETEKIAEKIIQLSNDKEKYVYLKENARKNSVEKFDIKLSVEKIKGII